MLKRLQELDFLDLTISERVHYCKFASTVFFVIGSADHLFCKPSEFCQLRLQVLWTRLELFTPAESDVIKYATVRETYSGRPEDVASYLIELKKYISIGQEGSSCYVAVGEDQRLYANMMNLKRKNLDTFEWHFPVTGDWLFIKTVSEVLKSVLWDGGFHDIAANCGMKKEVSK